MSARAAACGLILLCAVGRLAAADEPPAAPASASEDRLILSADGATLTGGSGGGGAGVLWSHIFAPGDTLSAGGEYQQVANSHWTNGILGGSVRFGSSAPTTLYAEAHEGAGDIAQRGFHYSVETAGLLNMPASWLTVQLEERRIDVDTSHGNLPKVGLAFRVAQPLLLSVSYADTAGGNLGTQLTTLRLDYAGRAASALAGAAEGHAAPAVLNLLGQIVQPRAHLTELFAGAGRTFGRANWQLLADYQDLEGFKRTTITLSCTLRLDGRSPPP